MRLETTLGEENIDDWGNVNVSNGSRGIYMFFIKQELFLNISKHWFKLTNK